MSKKRRQLMSSAAVRQLAEAVVLRLEQAVQALASLLVAFLEFAQRALEGCARSALGERSRQLTLHLAQGLAVLPALAETAGQG